MKFTVDIDQPFTIERVGDWHNSHYAIIQVLAEKGIFYEINKSAHGRIHVDFSTERQLEDKDMLLMRLALGDDIRRLRMDAVRYFLNIKIDQVIE